MEELYLLDALLTADLESIPEQQGDSEEEGATAEPQPQANSHIGDIQTSLQSLFDLCASFQPSSPRVTPSVLPPKLLSAPLPDLYDSLAPWILSYHHHLAHELTLIRQHFLTTVTLLHTAESTITVMTKLLKSKDETIDSISEELYLGSLEKNTWQNPEQDLMSFESSVGYSGRKTEGLTRTMSLFEVEEDENWKKLADVLSTDSMRQRTVLSQSVHIWKSQSCAEEIPSFPCAIESLEGIYKRNLLLRNPLLSNCSGSAEFVLPPPCLFSQFFSFLDQCFAVAMNDSMEGFSCVKCVAEGKVLKRMGDDIRNGLTSLGTYYAEDSMVAGVFSRLLHVFDSDPLLSAPSKELVLLNATLKYLTIKRNSVRDLESGGYIAIKDVINFAFTLSFSANEPLLTHFLHVLRPSELSELEWTKFVVSQRSKDIQSPGSPIDLSTGPMAVLRSFVGDFSAEVKKTEDFTSVGSLFEVGRGEVLGYLLQVYDLYVDELYVLVGSRATKDQISLSEFHRLVTDLHPGLSRTSEAEMWAEALSYSQSSETGRVQKDAVLLAIITSSCPEVAANPLISSRKRVHRGSLTIKTEMTEESEDVYLSSYPSKPRPLFTPRGRQSVRRSGQSLSIPPQ